MRSTQELGICNSKHLSCALWWRAVDVLGVCALSRPSKEYSTDACWSVTRPSVFFETKMDGSLDVWDMSFCQKYPTLNVLVSTCTRTTSTSLGIPSSTACIKSIELHHSVVKYHLWRAKECLFIYTCYVCESFLTLESPQTLLYIILLTDRFMLLPDIICQNLR